MACGRQANSKGSAGTSRQEVRPANAQLAAMGAANVRSSP